MEFGHRLKVGLVRTIIGLVSISAFIGIGVWLTLDWVTVALQTGISYFRATGGSGVAESVSLLDPSLGIFVGPLLFLGGTIVLAIPYLIWAIIRCYRSYEPTLLIIVVYGVFFLLMAMLQLRFSGHLALVSIIFGGMGVVHLAWKVDLAERPGFLDTRPKRDEQLPELTFPSRRAIVNVAVLLMLVGGFGIIQTPVKISQLTHDGDFYDAATAMSEYADEHDLEYPRNYVLSDWGKNRMLNYFVNGQSQIYSFAQDNYGPFVRSTDPDQWYERLKNQTGFIITTDSDEDFSKTSIQYQLHRNYGSGFDGGEGVSHYQCIYVSPDGSVKAFALVEGATIRGVGAANETVQITTTVTLNGKSFPYNRSVKVKTDGSFSVTVPYPGTYRVGDGSVTVSEAAVQTGQTVNASARS
jgi:dolichyl-diphosphooligosaccharide--protein glycosyltransferase